MIVRVVVVAVFGATALDNEARDTHDFGNQVGALLKNKYSSV